MPVWSKVHVPRLLARVLPLLTRSMNNSTVAPPKAVPENVSVLSLVTPSAGLAPVSSLMPVMRSASYCAAVAMLVTMDCRPVRVLSSVASLAAASAAWMLARLASVTPLTPSSSSWALVGLTPAAESITACTASARVCSLVTVLTAAPSVATPLRLAVSSTSPSRLSS